MNIKILTIILTILFLIPLANAQVFNVTHNLTQAIHLIQANNNNTELDSDYSQNIDITIGLNDTFGNTTFETDSLPTTNVTAYYRFEDASGTNAADISGNELNGTLIGGTIFINSKKGNDTGSFATRFDGSDDYIRILDNNLLDFGTEDFSYSFWLNTSQSGTRQGLLNKRVTGAGGGFAGYSAFIFETGDIIRVAIEGTSGGAVSLDSLSNVTTGEWVHIVATHDRGGLLKIYVNGIKEAETSIAAVNGATDNTLDLLLGVNNAVPPALTNFYDGDLDEVNLWNFTLTDNQVETIFENGINLDITAIKVNFSVTLNEDNNYFLRLEKASSLNATVSVHAYINGSGINTTNSSIANLESDVIVININSIIINGADAVFRFFSNTLRLFSRVQLIEEITDVVPPSIINCQVNNTALSCDDSVRFSCNATDISGISQVFFGFNDSDGENFEEASLDTGDIFIFDKQYTSVTSGSIEIYNFTNATATDIASNLNLTLLNIQYNYSCSAPDVTDPIINTALINLTIFNQLIQNFEANSFCTDDVNVSRYQITLSNSSGIVFNETNISIELETNISIIRSVNLSTFAQGLYDVDFLCLDSSDNQDDKNFQIGIVNFDTIIQLVEPDNNTLLEFQYQFIKDTDVTFTYSLPAAANCSLIINSSVVETIEGVAGNNSFVRSFNFDQVIQHQYVCTLTDFVGQINSSFHVNEIVIFELPEEYSLAVCPTDTTPRAIMFIFLVLLAFIIITLAFTIKNGLLGTIGGILLIVTSAYLYSCIVAVGIIITGLGIFMVVYFIFKGTKNFN